MEEALADAARPGYQRYDELSGLPAGWVLFDRVQILSSINPVLVQHLDLNSLQPIASTQASLHGGMVLPGNIKKWSSFSPPELRVTVDEDSTASATVASIRALTSAGPDPITKSTGEPVLIWDLSTQFLVDGDYEIAVSVDGSPMGRPLRMRLRSADHPAVMVDPADAHIAHDHHEFAYGLLASRDPSARTFQVAPADERALDDQPAPPFTPLWVTERAGGSSRVAGQAGSTISVPSPKTGSCMLTGAHVMVIDTVQPGQPKKNLIDGMCKHCGITKHYPTSGRRKRAKVQKRTGPVFDASSLEPVRARTDVDWRLGLDALSHLKAGPISSLDRVAAQIDATGLFTDAFARRLEALGHIEIERSATTLKPARWAISAPCLIELASGRYALVGFRSESMLAAVEDLAYGRGVDHRVETIDGPPLVTIAPSDPEVLIEIVLAMSIATGFEARLIPGAAHRLAASLPPLSKPLRALPTTSATSARNIERWDPATARFVPSTGTSAPGAYRLNGFARAYIYRRPDDVEKMTAALGDARIVKYAAAVDSGVALVGYDDAARVLFTPLGADLPGLYGRAAVLASGQPAVEDERQRILQYRDVPPVLANRIQCLLMS